MEEREHFLKMLGARIIALREEKSISQSDLAYRAEMESSSLRKVEKGRVNATVYTLRRICKALGITMANLFDFEP